MMAAPDDMLYEYAVVRYVPRVDREEFINMGLIMMCKRRKWLKGKIEIDRKRLEAFDPDVALLALTDQSRMFEMTDIPSDDLPVEEKYRWLTAVKSGVLQVSPSHPGFIPAQGTESRESALKMLTDEFDRLLDLLVRPVR